jgi:hypothetical protein
MFALIAAIVWFLAAFGVQLGGLNMTLFGAAFLALHFAITWWPVSVPWGRRSSP